MKGNGDRPSGARPVRPSSAHPSSRSGPATAAPAPKNNFPEEFEEFDEV